MALRREGAEGPRGRRGGRGAGRVGSAGHTVTYCSLCHRQPLLGPGRQASGRSAPPIRKPYETPPALTDFCHPHWLPPPPRRPRGLRAAPSIRPPPSPLAPRSLPGPPRLMSPRFTPRDPSRPPFRLPPRPPPRPYNYRIANFILSILYLQSYGALWRLKDIMHSERGAGGLRAAERGRMGRGDMEA